MFVEQCVAQNSTFSYTKDFNNILNQTNDQSSDLHYAKLLARFKSNDNNLTTYEILALLIGFTDNVHFKPYHYLDVERKIYSLNENNKYGDAIRLADSLLANIPVSQQALIEKSFAHHKLNQPDSAE